MDLNPSTNVSKKSWGKKTGHALKYVIAMGIGTLLPFTTSYASSFNQLQFDNLQVVAATFQTHLQNNQQILNIAKEKSVVLLFGNTGAGKSTFCNMMQQISLVALPDQTIALQDPADPKAFQIGAGATSVTTLPRAFELDESVFF